MTEQEIQRLGAVPAGRLSAPGTNPERLDLNYRNAPLRLPALEGEIRRLIEVLLASAPAAQERLNGGDLPQVAEMPTPSPAAPAAVPAASAAMEV